MAHISFFTLNNFYKTRIFISVILACLFISGILLNYYAKCPEPFDWSGFWLSVSTNILGIWIAVNLVDSLMNRRAHLTQSRQEFLNETKFFSDFASRNIPDFHEKDLHLLQKEFRIYKLKWFKDSQYAYILKENEEDIARKCYSFNAILIQDIEHFLVGLRLPFSDDEIKARDREERLIRLKKAINDAETALESLVVEYWKSKK